MIKWVHKSVYLEEAGLTDGWLRGHIQRGNLTPGEQYCVEGKTTMINPEAMDQWWKERGLRASTLTDQASASASNTKGRGTQRSSPATITGKVISPQRFAAARS